MKAAKETMRKAYEKAKSDYTKAVKLDEAEAMTAELKQFTSNSGQTKKSDGTARKDDLFQAGSVWKGEFTNRHDNVSRTYPVEMTVTERDGKKFKAKMVVALDVGKAKAQVRLIDEGTITESGAISWTAAKMHFAEAENWKAFDHSGSIQGEKIKLRFSGVSLAKKKVNGEINLDLILYGLPESMPVERELLASGFKATLGSSSAIVAHNLASLGLKVGFVTRVGSDELVPSVRPRDSWALRDLISLACC